MLSQGEGHIYNSDWKLCYIFDAMIRYGDCITGTAGSSLPTAGLIDTAHLTATCHRPAAATATGISVHPITGGNWGRSPRTYRDAPSKRRIHSQYGCNTGKGQSVGLKRISICRLQLIATIRYNWSDSLYREHSTGRVPSPASHTSHLKLNRELIRSRCNTTCSKVLFCRRYTTVTL